MCSLQVVRHQLQSFGVRRQQRALILEGGQVPPRSDFLAASLMTVVSCAGAERRGWPILSAPRHLGNCTRSFKLREMLLGEFKKTLFKQSLYRSCHKISTSIVYIDRVRRRNSFTCDWVSPEG